MKKLILLVIILFNCSLNFAQVTAFPGELGSIGFMDYCFDLDFVDPMAIGYQVNVDVSYHLTEADAINNVNPLLRLFTFTGTELTIYSRVSSTIDSSFDTNEVSLVKIPPLAPPGLCGNEVCDLDNDGSEEVNLNNLVCWHTVYNHDDNLCGSPDSDLSTKYYLTETDAINETNEIPSVYTITGFTNFFRKVKNVVTNDQGLLSVSIDLISCTDDTDSDGIPDKAEDSNRNYNYYDDDADLDGLKDYLDDDDDNDGILTINEDYNGNGTPLDDDTDSSGVPDYLEANVALFSDAYAETLFSIYPVPAKGKLYIKDLDGDLELLRMYTIEGKEVVTTVSRVNDGLLVIDLQDVSSGVYFLMFQLNNRVLVKRVLVE